MYDYVALFVFALVTLIGSWLVVHPAGVIGWAKRAYPALNEEHPRLRFVARFVGGWFIGLSVLVFTIVVLARYR